jgi:uncharacterized protein (DUF58 family)
MRPTRAALWSAGALLVLGLGTALSPHLRAPFRAALVLFVLALAADALMLLRRALPRGVRTIPRTMALGERYELVLAITGDRHERARAYELAHPPGELLGLPAELELSPGRITELRYGFRPHKRGALHFPAPRLVLSGALRLLERALPVAEPAELRVTPNFKRVAELVAPGEEALYRGVRLTRKRGEGMEFDELRAYREGDALRQIDWKSVARRQQLVSRAYRSEQNQHVVFVLDSGRRMRARDGALSLLDQALNALLLVSYVALRQGDSVSVLSFGREVRYLPPVRGAEGLSRVLDSVYDLESSTEPGDVEEALRVLAARQSRRALVVLLTNLGDDDDEALRAALLPLQKRHLVLVASLRDPELSARLGRPVQSEDDALTALSLLAYLGARDEARARLARERVASFECEPSAMPRALIERYLTMKRGGGL